MVTKQPLQLPPSTGNHLTPIELFNLPRIIDVMRVLIVILMAALLPLRAWLGDAMAMQTVAVQSNAVESIARSLDQKNAKPIFSLDSETSHLPCHGSDSLTNHALETLTTTDVDDLGDCGQCSACQVCHGAAIFLDNDSLTLLAQPAALVHGAQTLFASVPRAPHLKPPIS